MNHLQFVIEIIASNIGLISIISGLVIYSLNKKKETLFRILTSVGFMFIVVSFTVYQYLYNISSDLIYKVNHLPLFGIAILIPSMSHYINEIIEKKRRKIINSIFLYYSAISILLFILYLIIEINISYIIMTLSIGLGSSILYISLNLVNGKYKSLTKNIGRNRKIAGIIALIFLPLFILVDVYSFSKINAVPLFFLTWSITFIYEDILSLIYLNKKSKIDGFTINNGLTPREHETMILLIKGYKYQEIADELFISRETVKSHIKKIYSKCKVSNKVQLIRLVEPFV